MTNWGAPQPGPNMPAPWQDEHGQWHYPYGAHTAPGQEQWVNSTAAPAPAHPDPAPQSQIVPATQLDPVGPPRYYGPLPATRDPRRNTMAAVITFVSLVIALWAILGFMGSLSKTLTSISSGTDTLKGQLGTANEGLAKLEAKTGNLNTMADDSTKLKASLEGIDGDMGEMLAGVERISESMQAMDGSLSTLDSELGAVNDVNAKMAADLADINTGLATQKGNVTRMRKDVAGTATVLKQIPGRLKATNGRLTHINSVVNYMGCTGILNNLQVKIFLGPINNGSATVVATVVPPGAWGTKQDGTPC